MPIRFWENPRPNLPRARVMSVSKSVRIPSLVKKYLMALTGLVLVLFVMGHMLGNLQFFLGADAINEYAYHLHNLPGHPVSLLAIRLFLGVCLVVHVWMAILLTMENKAARPDSYATTNPITATYAARTMPITGLVLLFFVIFHILHYTVRVVPEDYNATISTVPLTLQAGLPPVQQFDVYAMMVVGFSKPIVSLFYLLAVGLLCMHLTHGVASMFQSVGLRNQIWRQRLGAVAMAYGWIVFLGFASIPISVLAGVGSGYVDGLSAPVAAVEQPVQVAVETAIEH